MAQRQHQHQDGRGVEWLRDQGGLRNYAPFLSHEWRTLERWMQAIRTGQEAVPDGARASYRWN